jgi:hypothetical protein
MTHAHAHHRLPLNLKRHQMMTMMTHGKIFLAVNLGAF